MRIKILCCLLVVLIVGSLCACDLNFTGTMLMLDQYTAEDLVEQYEQYASGEKDVEFKLNERIPVVEAYIQSPRDVENAVTVKFCASNKGFYDITFYGSIWVVTGKNHEIYNQAKFYNTEKKVANADYQVRLDPDHSYNFIYSVMDDLPTLDDNTLFFIFFHYDESDYVAALDFKDNFTFWPLSSMKARETTKK